MDVREKLVKLLGGDMCKGDCCYDCEFETNEKGCIEEIKRKMADYLIANGVTITPAVPGPSEADPNIMELCFRNGENHMREKIKTSLLKLSADMPCVTISQAIKILEDL